jgi:hypothetical protein
MTIAETCQGTALSRAVKPGHDELHSAEGMRGAQRSAQDKCFSAASASRAVSVRKIAGLLPLLLLLLSALAAAQSRSWNISDYSSSVLIEESGTSVVTERITCVFVGQYHGIYRRIPI